MSGGRCGRRRGGGGTVNVPARDCAWDQMEDRMTAVNGANEGHGASVKRVEDPPFLRGTRPYTDDLRRPDALYAVFVRSGFAHATINGIDTSMARDAPGVVGVYTAADLHLERFPTSGTPEE